MDKQKVQQVIEWCRQHAKFTAIVIALFAGFWLGVFMRGCAS